MPADWVPLAGKKGYRRYSTDQLQALARAKEAALEAKEKAQGGILQVSGAGGLRGAGLAVRVRVVGPLEGPFNPHPT